MRPGMDVWLPAMSLAYATGCDFRATLSDFHVTKSLAFREKWPKVQ